MSKKIVWPSAKVTSAKTAGTYGSYQEFVQKANVIRSEQEQAQAFLKKAMPAMVALLDFKLRHKEPLVVMRPLRYQTSEIQKGDDVDDAFYNRRREDRVNDKFTDVVKTILPGTQLVLKSLDMSLQEFIFEDARGKEHAINFVERDNLLTQTSIYEEVKKFIEEN